MELAFGERWIREETIDAVSVCGLRDELGVPMFGGEPINMFQARRTHVYLRRVDTGHIAHPACCACSLLNLLSTSCRLHSATIRPSSSRV